MLRFPILKGLVSYIPGITRLLSGTGGTNSAKYCYSVWLRHLVMAYNNNLPTQIDTVAEIGPGDSLGIGLSALLSGVKKYYAIDIIKYANADKNIEIFDELVELLNNREKIPHEEFFSNIKPSLKSYDFPSNILNDSILKKSLNDERIEDIRKELKDLDNYNKQDSCMIYYFVPWFESKQILNEPIDMILSQAVMEHIENLTLAYKTMYRWLSPLGFISHQIDFKSHGTSRKWNGHWSYSDFTWRVIKGKKNI